jgi:hypothetical protein
MRRFVSVLRAQLLLRRIRVIAHGSWWRGWPSAAPLPDQQQLVLGHTFGSLWPAAIRIFR